MHNQGVVHKIVEAAGIRSVDAVYEAGCGTGNLTMEMLPLARRLYTVDLEPRMVQETQRRAADAGFDNLEASVGDILKLPWPRRFDVCVSNLPFQMSAAILLKLMKRLSDGPPWRSTVMMLQTGFAERLLADPGEQFFSRIALNIRLFAKVTRLFDVKAGSFVPEPQTNATVIRLEPRLPAPAVDFAEWDALIRLLFTRRRKTLRAQFKKLSTQIMLEQNHKMRCTLMGVPAWQGSFPELIDSVLLEEGVVNERAFCMDLEDLHSLLRAFHRKNIYFVNVQGSLNASDGDGGGSDDELYGEGDGPHGLLRPGRRLNDEVRPGVLLPEPTRLSFRALKMSYP